MNFIPVVRPETLDFTSLSRVNGGYVVPAGERHSDIVWKLRTADESIYIYLLLEFQSRVDSWMALRMQGYVHGLLDDLQRRKELSRGQLPPVLPIVLYTGRGKWSAARELSGLQGPVPSNLQPFQPAIKYWLIEGTEDGNGSCSSNLISLLFRLENCGPDEISQVLAHLKVQLSEEADSTLRRDFAVFVTWLLRRKTNDLTIQEAGDRGYVCRLAKWLGAVLYECLRTLTSIWPATRHRR